MGLLPCSFVHMVVHFFTNESGLDLIWFDSPRTNPLTTDHLPGALPFSTYRDTLWTIDTSKRDGGCRYHPKNTNKNNDNWRRILHRFFVVVYQKRSGLTIRRKPEFSRRGQLEDASKRITKRKGLLKEGEQRTPRLTYLWRRSVRPLLRLNDAPHDWGRRIYLIASLERIEYNKREAITNNLESRIMMMIIVIMIIIRDTNIQPRRGWWIRK